MTKRELIDLLVKRAKEYRNNAQESLVGNRHMNKIEEGEQVQQRHIDAVITDFINFIGNKMCMDVALYTDDLNEIKIDNLPPNYPSLVNWEENNT